jgi:hypothetical protein
MGHYTAGHHVLKYPAFTMVSDDVASGSIACVQDINWFW